MTFEEIKPFLEQLVETTNVEYKSAAPFQVIKQKLMRSAIAMANSEDGGWIFVGVKESGGGYEITGLSPECEDSYAKVDSPMSAISSCAEPPIQVGLTVLLYDEKKIAAFRIQGLSKYPHIAVKTVKAEMDGISKGVVYIRTESPSSEACDALQWAQLMRRSQLRMVSNYMEEMKIVGCGLQFKSTPMIAESADDQFRKEREGN